MSKIATPYAEALGVAQELVRRLQPAVQRIEIAGSLRRQKTEVGDIEIVCIPRFEWETDLFGNQIGPPVNLVDAALSEMAVLRSKNGPAFKQFGFQGLPVDLFLVTSLTWGVQLAIRTGAADFSHWLVTARILGGALPDNMRVYEGRLWRGGEARQTPEERDVFAELGLAWIAPQERLRGRWNGARP